MRTEASEFDIQMDAAERLDRVKAAKQRKDDIVKMVEAGFNAEAIAEEVNVSVTYVRRVAQILGVPFVRVTKGNPEVDDKVVEEYVVKGRRASEICDELQITMNQFYTILERKQVPLNEIRAEGKMANKARLDAAIELYLKGVKTYDIFTHTGIHASRMYQELSLRGIPRRGDLRQKQYADVSAKTAAIVNAPVIELPKTTERSKSDYRKRVARDGTKTK